jgi:hypothetical protein
VTHAGFIAGLVIVLPVSFWGARCIGDTVPWLAFMATGAFMILIFPHVPHSPIACLLNQKEACGKPREMDWLMTCAFLVPMGAAIAVKIARGDSRRGRVNR